MNSRLMLWSSLSLLIVSFTETSAMAHPGVGIVQDRRGNVYFTDLKQVWKVTPDHRMAIALPNVHTHELCLDADDNLYGEHLWGEGGGWRHRVWCLKRDGTLSDVVPAREGFLRDYGFVRDRAGNMYWTEPGAKPVIKKRSSEGVTTTLAAGDLRAVQSMTVTPAGTLFFMDGGDLRQVSLTGQISTVSAGLSEHKPSPSTVSERNYHMGLWTDKDGAVYVAVARERLVIRVEPDGRTKVVVRSGGSWSPSGGMFDRDGKLWLLEYDDANSVRARRIDKDGNDRVFATDSPVR